MIYTSRRRNFRQFIKTRNLKYYIAFLAMVMAVIVAVIVITKNGKQNKIPDDRPDNTGVADNETDSGTDNETETDIVPETVRGIYQICVNLATNRIAVYEWNDDEEAFSDKAERYMLFASKNIQEGEYKAPYSHTDKNAWKESENETRFYRYATELGNKLIFHSADYNIFNDKNSLLVESYSAIGKDLPDGPVVNVSKDDVLSDGITLTLADAKWIYENCSYECSVKIYSNPSEDLYEPAYQIISIPDDITWEPTDSSYGTPWCQTEIATLDSPKQFELISLGAPLSYLLERAKATDITGADVSKYVYLSGDYDLDEPGEYSLHYNLIDIFGNHIQNPFKLVVSGHHNTTDDAPDDITTAKETSSENSPSVETTEQESSYEPATSENNSEYITDSYPETESESETFSDFETVSDFESETSDVTLPETDTTTEPFSPEDTETVNNVVTDESSDNEITTPDETIPIDEKPLVQNEEATSASDN